MAEGPVLAHLGPRDAVVSTLAALSVYALGYADVPQSNSSIGSEMTTQSLHASPILVTGAAGAVGSIGRNVTEMLLAKGHKVRALVRRRMNAPRPCVSSAPRSWRRERSASIHRARGKRPCRRIIQGRYELPPPHACG